MATYEEMYQQSVAAGIPPAEIADYLRRKQMTGALRGLGLGGEAMAEGAEGTLALAGGLPGRLPQLAGYDPWWTEGDVLRGMQGVTDPMGVTNNPRLVPGLGPNPEMERLGAAAMRGVGAGLPLLPLAGATAMPLALGVAGNAASGVAAEGARELFPENSLAPGVAGAVMGGLVGGAGALGAGARGALPAVSKPTGDVTRLLVGEALGTGATHFGLLPGGDVMGSVLGGLAGYMSGHVASGVGNAVARNILHPWVLQGMGAGASAGYSTPEPLPGNTPF